MKSKFTIGLMFLGLSVSAQVSADFRDKIDFSMVGNNSLIQVGVKGKKATFIFDTGAEVAVVDAEFAKEAGITVKQSPANVNSTGGVKYYGYAQNQSITFNKTVIDGLLFITDDLTALRKSLSDTEGYELFDGIVGRDLYSRYKTEINFDHKALFLYGKDQELDMKDYGVIDFTSDSSNYLPRFNITIKEGGKIYDGMVIFDSGFNGSLMVGSHFENQYKLAANAKKAIGGFSNVINGKRSNMDYNLDELIIGSHTFRNIRVSSYLGSGSPGAGKPALGNLGAEIIKRFNWVIDYKAKKLYYRPNSLFNQTFPKTLTGFSMEKNANNEIVVSNIAPISPFYHEGLQNGDIVLSVNGIKDLKAIKKELRNEGKEVILIYRRDGLEKTIKLVLRNIL